VDQALYDEMYRLEQRHWWFAAKRRIVGSLLERFSTVLPTEERKPRVCDLGCGCGMQAAELAARGWDVVGVDASEDALTNCRSRGVEAMHGLLPDDIPVPPATMDAVLLLDVLEHIEDDAATLTAGAERVRSGGVVIVTVPAYAWMWTGRDAHHHHKRRYSRRRFNELIGSCGTCEVELVSFLNTILFPLAMVARLGGNLLRRSNAAGDLTVPRLGLNALLGEVFAFERHLLRRGVRLPWGLSLVAVLRKKGD
jgi:SAM-dependent methyltransferase